MNQEVHYSLLIQWDPRDNIYVVTVPELGGLHTHGTTYEEAVAQAQDLITGYLDVAEVNGLPIPPAQTYADTKISA